MLQFELDGSALQVLGAREQRVLQEPGLLALEIEAVGHVAHRRTDAQQLSAAVDDREVRGLEGADVGRVVRERRGQLDLERLTGLTVGSVEVHIQDVKTG